MGHDGRAKNSYRDIEHGGVPHNVCRRQETANHLAEWWLRQDDLEQEADTDGRNQGDYKRFEQSESLVLEIENYEYVSCRDDNAIHHRNPEEKIECDRGADYLGKVARGNCDLAGDPKKEIDGPRIVVA